jgi:hypothetical protein
MELSAALVELSRLMVETIVTSRVVVSNVMVGSRQMLDAVADDDLAGPEDVAVM